MGETELLDLAWGVIANAGGGDWSNESGEWIDAATRWRDQYHAWTEQAFCDHPHEDSLGDDFWICRSCNQVSRLVDDPDGEIWSKDGQWRRVLMGTGYATDGQIADHKARMIAAGVLPEPIIGPLPDPSCSPFHRRAS